MSVEPAELVGGGLDGLRGALEVARSVVGRPIPHQYGPRRPGDPPVLVAAGDRASAVLGWHAARGSLEEMVGSAWRLIGARATGGAP